jgi:hypothetical protein
VGSIAGPIAVCQEFGEFDLRVLSALLDTAGTTTNYGLVLLAMKEVRAFWESDDAPEEWSEIPWIGRLPPDDRALLDIPAGRQLFLDSVRKCFAALLGHLLSLLACLSASGAWNAVIGDVSTLAERIQMPRGWPLSTVATLCNQFAQRHGAPAPWYWGDGEGQDAPLVSENAQYRLEFSELYAATPVATPPRSVAGEDDFSAPWEKQRATAKRLGRARTVRPERRRGGALADRLLSEQQIADLSNSFDVAALQRRDPQGPSSENAPRATEATLSSTDSSQARSEGRDWTRGA